MKMKDINPSWKAKDIKLGCIYVYAGTMEEVRAVARFSCQGVWLERPDGTLISNGQTDIIPFDDVLYATKDEVEDYLEDHKVFNDNTLVKDWHESYTW